MPPKFSEPRGWILRCRPVDRRMRLFLHLYHINHPPQNGKYKVSMSHALTKKLWLKPPKFETSFETTKASVELDCFSVYIAQWFCASDRREELNCYVKDLIFRINSLSLGLKG